MSKPFTQPLLTRRALAQRTLAGVAGALLASSLPAGAQVVDPNPSLPPPLPAPVKPMNEGDLLTQLIPINVGYQLTDTQSKEAALQLKEYPGAFGKARAYLLPDDIGPAFAATAPVRKERTK